MNYSIFRPVMAAVFAATLLAGCNQEDRSQTKGVDGTSDAQNARDPARLKDPSMKPSSGDARDESRSMDQSASSAGEQPKSSH